MGFSLGDVGRYDYFSDGFCGCFVIVIGAEGDEIGARDGFEPESVFDDLGLDGGMGGGFFDDGAGRDDGDLVPAEVF